MRNDGTAVATGGGRSGVVDCPVLLIGDCLEPRGGLGTFLGLFDECVVAHHGALGGAVPVLLPGRGPDRLPGTQPDDRAVPVDDEAVSLGADQELTEPVVVPMEARARGEADEGR